MKTKTTTTSTLALLSSLQAVANPRLSHADREVAFTHLTAQFMATLPKEFGSGMGAKVSPGSPSLNDLIAALGVAADPAALPEKKKKAIEMLLAYFKSLPSKALPSKDAQELSSAIKTLATRIGRAEKVATSRAKLQALVQKASAVRPHGAATLRKGTSPHRAQMATCKDGVIEAIERAERTVLRSLGKDIPLTHSVSTATDHIEREERNALRALGKI